jgi:hypothetical protein
MNDVRCKQRAVIKFLVAEKESVGNIYNRLCNVYGTAKVDRCTVDRWTKRVTTSESLRLM